MSKPKSYKPGRLGQSSNQSSIPSKITKLIEDNLEQFEIKTSMKIELNGEEPFVVEEATRYKVAENFDFQPLREFFSRHEKRLKSVSAKVEKVKNFDVKFRIMPIQQETNQPKMECITEKNQLSLIQQKVHEAYDMFNRNIAPKPFVSFNTKHNYLLQNEGPEKNI